MPSARSSRQQKTSWRDEKNLVSALHGATRGIIQTRWAPNLQRAEFFKRTRPKSCNARHFSNRPPPHSYNGPDSPNERNQKHPSLLFKEALLAHRGPDEIHLSVVLLDESLYDAELTVSQHPTVPNDRVAVTVHKELRRATFRQAGIARMDMYALNDAVCRKVEVVPANLEAVVLRHLLPPSTLGCGQSSRPQ